MSFVFVRHELLCKTIIRRINPCYCLHTAESLPRRSLCFMNLILATMPAVNKLVYATHPELARFNHYSRHLLSRSNISELFSITRGQHNVSSSLSNKNICFVYNYKHCGLIMAEGGPTGTRCGFFFRLISKYNFVLLFQDVAVQLVSFFLFLVPEHTQWLFYRKLATVDKSNSSV